MKLYISLTSYIVYFYQIVVLVVNMEFKGKSVRCREKGRCIKDGESSSLMMKGQH